MSALPAVSSMSMDRFSPLLKRLKTLWPSNDRGLPAGEGGGAGASFEADEREQTLIENVRDLRSLTAIDVMVPRVDIVGIDAGASFDDLMALFADKRFSRIPVYRGTLDDTIGCITIKDVLLTMARGTAINLADLIREVMIVSPALPALELLVSMQTTKRHLAMVVDEYGGIDGLVTMTDLIAAIVGEIGDEHDQSKPSFLLQKPDGSLIADARVWVEDIEEKLGDILNDDEEAEFETVGGMVTALAGRLPVRGELFHHAASGLSLEVLDADARRVKRVRLRLEKKDDPATPIAAEAVAPGPITAPASHELKAD
jgi:CBS domain containing-hemolysin-like protein